MPYTSHGHPYGETGPDEPKPDVAARCGGPGICAKCSQEAAQPATETVPTGHTRFKGAKHVSLYRITASNLPNVEVGSLIIDRGQQTPRTWAIYRETTGTMSHGFSGVRVGRVCPGCFAIGWAGQAGHDETDHGKHVPAVQAKDVTKKAKAR